MNYKMMGRFIAQILTIESIFMLPALAISIFNREYNAAKGFIMTLAILLAISLVLFIICRRASKQFFAKEGLFCVGISWIVLSILGCLPFYLSGEIPSYIDALFEMVSGFTTTGASVVANVEALSKGILYWRSFSHWLGGMGVLVFLLAITPSESGGTGFSMHLLRAESPGPNVGKLVPKMRKTALILYTIYIALTVLDLIFLLIGNMPFFDALCTTFSTAGTGGFGTKNDSLAGYSTYIQSVCTVFMILFGVNFSCFYLILIRNFKSVFKDEELRLYIIIIVTSVLLITLNIASRFDSIFDALHHAAFQVASLISTTGFSSIDYDLWPTFSKAILTCVMLIGACAGSTGGGLKCARVLILFKNLRRTVTKIKDPNKVTVIRNNGSVMDEKIIDNVNSYFAVYMILMIASFVVISMDHVTFETSVSAVIACFNNVGPGFGAVGPTCNFSDFSVLSKLIFIFDMLAGRLEIFPILVLFSGKSWKKK